MCESNRNTRGGRACTWGFRRRSCACGGVAENRILRSTRSETDGLHGALHALRSFGDVRDGILARRFEFQISKFPVHVAVRVRVRVVFGVRRFASRTVAASAGEVEALAEAHGLGREKRISRVAVRGREDEHAASALGKAEAGESDDAMRPSISERLELGDDVRHRGRLRRVVDHVPEEQPRNVLEEDPGNATSTEQAEDVRTQAGLVSATQAGARQVTRAHVLRAG